MGVDTRLLIHAAICKTAWNASELVAANMPWEWVDWCYIRLVDELIGGGNDLNPAFCLVCVGCHHQSIWISSSVAKIFELETDALWIAMGMISNMCNKTEMRHAAAVFWLAQITVTCCSGWCVCPVMGCESLWKLQVKERHTWISNKQPHSLCFEKYWVSVWGEDSLFSFHIIH